MNGFIQANVWLVDFYGTYAVYADPTLKDWGDDLYIWEAVVDTYA